MIIWEQSTAHCWTAELAGEWVATVRRPIKRSLRHHGWRVTEVLGSYAGCEYRGDDLAGAKAEAERMVRERVARLAAALATRRQR